MSVGTGALHVITSPLSVAALVGLVVALAGIPVRGLVISAIVACVGSVAASSTGGLSALATAACVCACGAYAALGLPPRMAAAPFVAALAGMGAGGGAELDKITVPALLGVLGCVGLVTTGGLALMEDLARFPLWRRTGSIARRALGAWVLALGMLMGALALRTG